MCVAPEEPKKGEDGNDLFIFFLEQRFASFKFAGCRTWKGSFLKKNVKQILLPFTRNRTPKNMLRVLVQLAQNLLEKTSLEKETKTSPP